MDKDRTSTAPRQRRALALALMTGCTALGLLTNTGCYVPPDDGIARTDTDPQEQQNEQTEEQQQGHEPRSPWDDLDQPPISSAPAQEQDPEEAQAAHQEANQLAKQGREALEADDPRQAVEHFEQAVNFTPNRAVLWQNLAAAQLEAGNYAEAEASAQRALDLADARDEPVIRESLWLVAAARKGLGDERGLRRAVEAAERQAGGPGQDQPPGREDPQSPPGPW